MSLQQLCKRFGDTDAVDGLSLQLPAGSFTALLGPSGCGKSTTLAMLAGLVTPDSGDIQLDGASLLNVRAERRPVSLVFQKPLLFPHLSVEQNVAFGLRMRRLPRREVRQRTGAMLERVQLGGLARRRVGELSGGQEQRVALARAFVLAPRVLLLDEPFSQLDASLRAEMRTLARTLHEELTVTTLFVTHDQAEAVEIADEVALMLDGQLAGHGAPELFYLRPPTLAAARFFGVTNELTGSVAAGRFWADHAGLVVTASVSDGPAVLVIRPESIQLVDDASVQDGGSVEGLVEAGRFAGTHLVLDVRLSDQQSLCVHVPVGTITSVGGRVRVRLPPEACTVFAPQPQPRRTARETGDEEGL